jgi:hypothetical protein
MVTTRTDSLHRYIFTTPICSNLSFTKVYLTACIIDEDRRGSETRRKDF